jgi:nucleoid-associated protein YgaU
MRKDVKFALIIGGVFLAVLILYISVNQTGDKGRNDVALVTTGGTVTSGGSSPTPAVTPPAPAPATAGPKAPAPKLTAPAPAAEDHVVAVVPPAPAPAVVDHSADFTPAPPVRSEVTPAAPAVDPANDPWHSALTYGMLDTVKPAVDIRPDAAGPQDIGPMASQPPSSDGSGTSPDSAAGGPIVTETPSMSGGPIVADATHIGAPAPLPTASYSTEPPMASGLASPSTRPVQANTGAHTHVVAFGETFSSIAQTVYGNSKYWSRIADANPQIEPRSLKPGMTLIIPAFSPPVVPATPAAVAPAPIDPKTEYRVQTGDSLYKIAVHLFNNGQWADKIYELNRTAIGADPAKLKVGQVLKLPPAPAAAAPAPAMPH